MKTAGICRCKDEADIIGSTVRWMLTQVDHVIVADNNSTDDTRDILYTLQHGNMLTVVDDPEVAYYQSAAMSKLAARALDLGADWIVPFDADEIWMSPHGRLGDILEEHSPDYGLVTAALYDHVATGLDDAYNLDPVSRMGWRRVDPLPLCKVAVRAEPGLVIAAGNHWAHHAIPARFTETPALAVHHFPYRSVEQLIRKVRNGAAAYEATVGLDESVGAHWRQWGKFSDTQIEELFKYWYFREDPREPIVLEGEAQPPLIYDPSPRV